MDVLQEVKRAGSLFFFYIEDILAKKGFCEEFAAEVPALLRTFLCTPNPFVS